MDVDAGMTLSFLRSPRRGHVIVGLILPRDVGGGAEVHAVGRRQGGACLTLPPLSITTTRGLEWDVRAGHVAWLRRRAGLSRQ